MRYLFIFGVFFLCLISGCHSGEAVEKGPGEIQVEDIKYSLLPGGARIVTGTLYNPTATPVKNAQIQVSLFDEHNRRVDDMSITVRDVPPGERKSFREPVNSDLDIQGAKVRSVLVM